ncbi:hypothetical protein COO60DRAFT_1114469 [Scenedesmus sp. NREL 46B-D3]|nr:hypothetical protein COO60DRAFT_1114469 [Scenedesmus sp. NREL 46B-D3]
MAARHPGGGLGSAAGSGRGYPDAFTVATTKLSQDWSANRCVSHVNEDWLNTLLDDARFSSIDAMLKVRLLLAGMVALNQQPPASQGSDSLPEREGLQGSLARLQAAAATDADEWVKVTAAAAGQLDGRLDLAAVMQQSAVVHETMTGLRRQMQEPSTQQQLFPPLEVSVKLPAGSAVALSCAAMECRSCPAMLQWIATMHLLLCDAAVNCCMRLLSAAAVPRGRARCVAECIRRLRKTSRKKFCCNCVKADCGACFMRLALSCTSLSASSCCRWHCLLWCGNSGSSPACFITPTF